MANNAANDIGYYLLIDKANESHLANLRHWNNLKIAFDGNDIWVKDIDHRQLSSLEIKSMPYKTLFAAKQGKLFLINSRLPNRNIPSLLWTPVERAMPVRLPSFNFNYFGINEKIPVSLIASDAEIDATAMITGIETLRQYIETVPAIRLRKLAWVILNGTKALIFGKPLLPVTGNVYWQRNDFLIPAGYDLDLYLLEDALNRLLNPGNTSWVVWDIDGSYSLIEKDMLQPLSISSFRTSFSNLSSTPV